MDTCQVVGPHSPSPPPTPQPQPQPPGVLNPDHCASTAMQTTCPLPLGIAEEPFPLSEPARTKHNCCCRVPSTPDPQPCLPPPSPGQPCPACLVCTPCPAPVCPAAGSGLGSAWSEPRPQFPWLPACRRSHTLTWTSSWLLSSRQRQQCKPACQPGGPAPEAPAGQRAPGLLPLQLQAKPAACLPPWAPYRPAPQVPLGGPYCPASCAARQHRLQPL